MRKRESHSCIHAFITLQTTVYVCGMISSKYRALFMCGWVSFCLQERAAYAAEERMLRAMFDEIDEDGNGMLYYITQYDVI
jgi:hypothetical protein